MTPRRGLFAIAAAMVVAPLASAGPGAVCVARPASAPLLLGASAGTVHFCTDAATPAPCFAVALDGGTYTAAPPGPATPPDRGLPILADVAGAAQVTTTPTTAKVCTADGACKTFTPTGVAPGGGDLGAAVDAAGTVVAIVLAPNGDGSPKRVETYDVKSGKKLAAFRAGTNNDPCVAVSVLGSSLMIDESNCAGPDDTAFLATARGKRIAKVGGGKPIDTFEIIPVALGGALWAFNSSEADEVVIQNVVTGKVTRRIKLGHTGAGPGQGVMVADGTGKLALVYSLDKAGDIARIDPATGKVTQIAAPVCPAPPTH